MRTEAVMTVVVQTLFRPCGLILLLLLCSLINLSHKKTTATTTEKKRFSSPLMRVTMTPIVD